jgi:hypothetical protein
VFSRFLRGFAKRSKSKSKIKIRKMIKSKSRSKIRTKPGRCAGRMRSYS